jgi:hypothetical protein
MVMKPLLISISMLVVGLIGLSQINLSKAQAASDTVNTVPKAKAQCIDASDLDRRQVVKPDTLLIEDDRGRAALLKLSAPCENMNDLDRIGFEFNGSTLLCDRKDIKILYSRFNESPLRCIIETITPITKAEADKY